MTDTLVETIIGQALDTAVASIAATNQSAATEIGTRRAQFTAMATPIMAALLSEAAAAGNQPSNQLTVALGEMQDAVNAFALEVQAITLHAERATLSACFELACNVAIGIIGSAAVRYGAEAVLILLA